MKNYRVCLAVACIFFLSSTSYGASKCKKALKKAEKTQALYKKNRKQAFVLEKRMTVLKKDKKRMPSSVGLAHRVVNHEIYKLKTAKKKKMVKSLKLLERHINYVKQVERNCIKKKRTHKVKKRVLMTIAQQ